MVAFGGNGSGSCVVLYAVSVVPLGAFILKGVVRLLVCVSSGKWWGRK